MAERVRVREITNVEGNKLLSIIRRGSGSVVRWRRAQMVLWSAQGMDVPQIARSLSSPRTGCGRVVSSDQDLEAVDRPGLRGQEEPGVHLYDIADGKAAPG